ncbi:hypothetical protein L7F22_042164 [Adiantum nelumboides]|nr:hypothetical protein [Adiantum nelumboides]
MIQFRYMTFTFLILISLQKSKNGAQSTSTDEESNRQERSEIDLNKPYVPDLNELYVPEHSSTIISSPSISFIGDSSSKHSTPQQFSSVRFRQRKSPFEYKDSKDAQRKREAMQQLKDQGEAAYRAYLDKKNEQQRIRRNMKKIFGDEKRLGDKLPINDKTIKQARKNIREGKATEEEYQIIQRRKKIEAKTRKKNPRIQQKKGQDISSIRERVRKGIAEPHELDKVLKMQERDRLYQHKRYLRKKTETSASKLSNLQPSNDLVKRTNERPAPKFDIDLNKSPPREDAEKEQELEPLLGIELSSSQDPKSTSLKPRKRPYKYYPRKQAHELSQNKKSIKYRIHREKLRNSENQDALIFHLEKQRERMIPFLEKYRKETKELGYSNRPDAIKKSQLRKKPGRDMESTNVQEKKRAKLDIDLNEPYVEEQISENERTPSASENAIIHDHLPAPQKEGDVEAQLTKRPYVYRPRKSLEELSQNKKAIKREGSSINGHDKSLKKGLSIDLNEDYVPGNSPESSPSRTEQARSSTPIIEQPQTLKGKKYIYIPRKTENQYSQSEAAQISRKMMKFLRENDKDGHQKYLAKERILIAGSRSMPKNYDLKANLIKRTEERRASEVFDKDLKVHYLPSETEIAKSGHSKLPVKKTKVINQFESTAV